MRLDMRMLDFLLAVSIFENFIRFAEADLNIALIDMIHAQNIAAGFQVKTAFCRKRLRFNSIGVVQGFPNNVICHIEEDDAGYFWISSFGGISRVRKAELDACANGLTNQVECFTYGRGEGMPTLECSGGLQPSGCRTADGCAPGDRRRAGRAPSRRTPARRST